MTLQATNATGLGTKGNAQVVDEAFAQAIKNAGFELHVWTVNDPQAADYWKNLNVDSSTTDRPKFLSMSHNVHCINLGRCAHFARFLILRIVNRVVEA